jgi:hypothetical protein
MAYSISSKAGARMTARIHAWTAAALAALAPLGAHAGSLSCDGGIVSIGDSKVDLLGKCGSPALEERSDEVAQVDGVQGGRRGVGAPLERWTYDFGKGRFVQVVTLVGGKVSAVERGSYGFAAKPARPERSGRATCDPAALAAGKLKLEVLARCGEPAMIDAWEEELRTVEKLDRQLVTTQVVTATVELWTYDFGPNQLLRFVRLENGKVVSVETGSYGYAR